MHAMAILRYINTWFWNEYVWLPSNITWSDISDTSSVNYAQFSDLRNGFAVALSLLFVRYILEQYVFSPLGQYLGLKTKVPTEVYSDITANKILEKVFSENRRIDHKQVRGLAKHLDWNERRVDRWIRRRLKKQKTLRKFPGSAWRFTFHSCAFCYGLYILWDKPWFWTTNYCWYDYPHHGVTNDIWWYYMLEIGFYMSSAVSLFMDVKRTDFLQLCVHHIVTIILLMFSWTINLFRAGSLIIAIHDVADIFLEAGKMAKYVKNQRVAEACFVVFTVVWFISRLVIYPFRILYSALYQMIFIVHRVPVYYIFISLLCILQVLHIFWTWLIMKIFLHSIVLKQSDVKDLRSDSGEGTSSSSENDAGTTNTSSEYKNK